MALKTFIKKSLKRESPLFQAIYKTYRFGCRCIYNTAAAVTKLDEHLVVFEAFQDRQYTCSPKALYLEMKNDPKYDAFHFIWVFSPDAAARNPIADERTEIVAYNTQAHHLACARAKYIITNSMPMGIIKLRPGQKLIETWHGTPLKRLGCDIEVDSNSINTKEEIHDRYRQRVQQMTHFLSPSDFYTEKLTSAFDLKGAGSKVQMIQQGYPRNDFLTKYTQEDVKRIKESLGVPLDKKVILYAPTFRDNQKLERAYSYSFTLEMDFDHLLETLGEEYVVLFRPHYFVASQFDFKKYEGKVYDVSKVDDVNEMYVISDMLITDYSSVFFDYAILKRPILLFMYDLELYQGQLRDFYIDLKELPFPIVRTQQQLEEAILDQFGGGFEVTPGYEQFNRTYTPMDDGNASKRVLEAIFDE
ncbi:MAG: CDP-glycerol glycerophosphotransferase family protein [Oscillospiraceae bacterium]|nr:CDP-glycerol glycerophosphotransferase family protein [Oscillospiraceae bacterium]